MGTLAGVRRVLLVALLLTAPGAWGASLPSSVTFLSGPVNGLLLKGKVLVYGDPGGHLKGVTHVLFTHARRDVAWAGVSAVAGGAAAIVPERERELFENPGAFWAAYETQRFHDYSQVNTKVLTEPVRVSRTVKGGDVLDLDGLRIEVIESPGYTRGAVSYWIETGNRRIACTGDLIYGDGQLFDLSSLQDAIPESKTRGYHGYAARAGDLIESLRKIAARKPDVIVPARGPVIENPLPAIDRLIARLQTLMASHFATDALLWYWGPDSLKIRSRKALDGKPVDSMPMAEQRPLPAWALAAGNSRLLLSQTGAAFLIDAGYKGIFDKLEELTASGRVKSLDGIWITHYHDDHTDYAQQLADRYGCPIYYLPALADVIEHPADYRLPCLTTNPITSGKPLPNGAKLRWHEFQLTAFDFPGQTLYHDGLLAERTGGEALFFAGDSFTPSGIDDYCLQNRDFLHQGEGFQFCLNVLEHLHRDVWLVNQHVEPTFRFSSEQIARMRTELKKRESIIETLSVWPDPNYEIDESWAVIQPYGATVRKGENVELELRIRNHGPRPETYKVRWNLPPGWKLIEQNNKLTIPGRKEGMARVVLAAGNPGLEVVTADIDFLSLRLRQWTEALIRVKP